MQYRLLGEAEEEERVNTDHQLNTLVQEMDSRIDRQDDEATAHTIKWIGNKFLNNESLLLASAYDYYCHLSSHDGYNSKRLLSILVDSLGHHFCVSRYGAGKKAGTLLYRCGCELQLSVFKSLQESLSQHLHAHEQD